MIAKLKAALLAALLSAFCGAAGAQFTQNTGYFAAGGGGGGSGGVTVGAAIDGSCTSGYLLYNNAGVIGCLQAVTTTGTPAAGDLPYYTSSSAQALVSSHPAGTVLTGAGASAPAYSATPTLGASGTLGTLTLGNATSGTILLTPAAGALGTVTLTLPATSGTILQSGTAVTVAQGGTGGATVQTATQALTAPRIIYTQGLPMIVPGTGTTDAAGAFTLGTALVPSTAIPAHAYCYWPANTVNDSHAAGWYYCTFSTTTAGVMYQDAYTPSNTPPTIPASPTAATTANNWTGVTSAATAISITVPANSLGLNGKVVFPTLSTTQSNSANAKSVSVTFGAFAALTTTQGSVANTNQAAFSLKIANSASTAVQILSGTIAANGFAVSVGGTVDTTADVTVSVVLTHGTATDNLAIWPFEAVIYSNGG